MIATIFQVILGFISNAKWTPDRTSIPWWDKAHWWFGRLLFLAGIANCGFGLMLYAQLYNQTQYLSITYWIYVALGFAVLIYGQFKFGQVRK